MCLHYFLLFFLEKDAVNFSNSNTALFLEIMIYLYIFQDFYHEFKQFHASATFKYLNASLLLTMIIFHDWFSNCYSHLYFHSWYYTENQYTQVFPLPLQFMCICLGSSWMQSTAHILHSVQTIARNDYKGVPLVFFSCKHKCCITGAQQLSHDSSFTGIPPYLISHFMLYNFNSLYTWITNPLPALN